MKSPAEKFLTKQEQEQIIQTVQEVEKTTSGEIVPMIVSASYTYPRAELAGALTLALITAVPATLALGRNDMWTFMGFFALAFFLFHFLVKKIPGLKLLFITAQEMAEEVEEAATLAFYRHNLHLTRDRTGILIFISVFERKVWVLADQGINEKVPPRTWEEIVTIITKGIKEQKAAEAICQAIRRCGQLIQEHFPRKADDTDELTNLIIGDRPV